MTSSLLRRHGLVLALLLSVATASCSDDEGPARPPRIADTVDEDRSIEGLDRSTARVHVRESRKPGGDVIIVLHGGRGDD